MTLLHAILLGLIQGLTEFLPVSSSGHLALAQGALGLTEPMLFFDVMLHAGTLLAVLIFYGRDIVSLVTAACGREAAPGAGGWRPVTADARKFILWLVIGTVPAGLAGLLFADVIEAALGSPVAAGAFLLVTATFLLAADRAGRGDRPAAALGPLGSLAVGAAQAVAILPGISRSGATICAAIFLGVDRRDAARFSFMLAIPAIAGATALELKDALASGIAFDAPVIAGTAIAFVSGLLALRWLISVLTGGRLLWFSIYCYVVGAAALAAFLILK